MQLIRLNYSRARLDSPGWWGLATFLIPVSQAVAQLVVSVLDAKGIATTPTAEMLVDLGVLASLAILLFSLPFRAARAAAIGATGMFVFILLGWAIHGFS
jgi:hypothetical protein